MYCILQGNPINALGHSISFGRFVSDSASWERWSVFSHNKYVEEAERYAQPGSVAQKKAFFEAHYKRMAAKKAAALLEQQMNAASSHETRSGHVDEMVNSTGNELPDPELNTRIVSSQEQLLEAENSETCSRANNDESNASVEMQKNENNADEGVDSLVEHEVVMENALVITSTNQQKKFTESDPCGTPNMEKPLLKVVLFMISQVFSFNKLVIVFEFCPCYSGRSQRIKKYQVRLARRNWYHIHQSLWVTVEHQRLHPHQPNTELCSLGKKT